MSPSEPPAPAGVAAEDLARLRQRLERERTARLAAEAIAERGLRDLYERQQELLLLEQIAAAANQTRSVHDIFQYALAQTCRFTRWPIGHACQMEAVQGPPQLRSMGIWHCPDPERIEEFRRLTEKTDFSHGRGLPGRVQKTAAPACLHDVAEDDNFPTMDAARRCGLRAACGFPVLVGQEVVAVLEFYSGRPLEPSRTLMRLMAQIGIQLGRVIERKRAEDALIQHDPLTGLPNRALFLDRLNQAFAHRRRAGDTKLAVLFIDLDRFKVVNDSLGPAAGDALIVAVAARLQARLRESDLLARPAVRPATADNILARLGGDEFTVLLNDIGGPTDAKRVAERIQETLLLPFTLADNEICVTASIGIATGAAHYTSADEMLRDADLAMYRAKGLGKARSELFDQNLHVAAQTRLRLETDLKQALRNNEFVLHYQPIVSLETRAIIEFEALARWQRPGFGLVSPGDFIPIAEETGTIIPLGRWVMREACDATKRWQQAFPLKEPLSISINLSASQFSQPDLVDQVRQTIAEVGIDPRTVRLEVTESVAMANAEQAIQVLSQLRQLGVRLSLDDFGTGYSSLSYLQRLPFDAVKIDRSFVSAVTKSAESRQIIDMIINLAGKLGMGVVAEGVEAEAEVAELRSLGCRFAQGFLFSNPVGDATIVERLRAMPLEGRSPAAATEAATPSRARHGQRLEVQSRGRAEARATTSEAGTN